MGELICPNCGSKVKLPEHSSVCVGNTFSKESKGTHYLQMEEENNTMKNNRAEEIKNMSKAELRLAALKAAGMDMSKYFKVTAPTGEEMLFEMIDGSLKPMGIEFDPIAETIISDGYVRNTKLHRRWVLAQMWNMLNYDNSYTRESGYDAALRAKGYGYQWDVLLEEVRVLSKLEERDVDIFVQRVHFFNRDVIMACCKDYRNKLMTKVNGMTKRRCKGIPYVKLNGEDIFVADLYKKVYRKIDDQIRAIERAFSYRDLYYALRNFVNRCVKKWTLPYDTKMCKEFIDAYKGAGAYYSLRNLVQFHDCKICVSKYETVRGQAAVKYLDSKLDEYKGEGWRYLAMLRKCISDNNWTPNWR